MSFRNTLLYGTFILLCWLWLNRDKQTLQSLSPSNSESIISSAITSLEDDVQPKLKAKPQVESENRQCKYPLITELDGKKFSLETTYSKQLPSINSNLRRVIDELLNAYANWFGAEKVFGIRFKMLILSPDDFADFMVSRGDDPINFAGVFFSGSNLAVIKYENKEQALTVAAHEAVHAINRAIFGATPRFLNEGLAKYFETRDSSGQPSDYELPKWVDKQDANAQLLDFYTLMYSEQDWHSTNNDSLYMSGIAWTHFLVSSELGLEAMIQLLTTKINSPCDTLTPEQIIDTLFQVYPNFEQDFYYWFEQHLEDK